MSKVKVAKVEVTAPKIATAWINAVNFINSNDEKTVEFLLKIVNEINAMKISVNDMEKVIANTGKESSLLKICHARGLTTWANLRRFPEFLELPLHKQLSSAHTSYKKIGIEGVAKETKYSEIQTKTKAKTRQANDKQNTPKAGKSKKPRTLVEELEQIEIFISSLNLDELSDDERDALNAIGVALGLFV